MASSKAKSGLQNEALKEGKGCPSSVGGEAAQSNRMYSLDELDTMATVGESLPKTDRHWTKVTLQKRVSVLRG